MATTAWVTVVREESASSRSRNALRKIELHRYDYGAFVFAFTIARRRRMFIEVASAR